MKIYPILLFAFILYACKGQVSTTAKQEIPASLQESPTQADSFAARPYPNPFQQDADNKMMLVMRGVFQDSRGTYWFIGDGVFRLDGDSLVDLSEIEAFKKTVTREILEDRQGNIWFGTHEGIRKFDGSAFHMFSKKDGLIDNDIWAMRMDSKGILWIGTPEGVSRFDGESFTTFVLPESEPDYTRGVTSARIIHSIEEDSKGNMWFASSGGAYIHDGKSLNHITEEDGLCNKVINDILEDKDGNIWFATHHNGVCYWDGVTFTNVTADEGVKGTEAWSLYEDSKGNIWFPIEHEGMYRYELSAAAGESALTNFHEKEGLPMGGVHSVFQDDRGRYWFFGFDGLYRYDPSTVPGTSKDSFVRITKDGPWGW